MTDSPRNQIEHPMMAGRSHDDAARQRAVRTLRQRLLPRLAAGSREMYYRGVEPELRAAADGRVVEDHREIRRAMMQLPYVRFQLATHRIIQELMFETLIDSVQPRVGELAEKARSLPRGLGSLRLDPTLEVPRYVTAVDIHCQPGGYAHELFEGDVAAGAIYDRSINMYQSGAGGMTDYMGRGVIQYLDKIWPQFQPRRILDLGCTIGHSTLAYARRYPDAEIHAIDVSAPLLRYAHARAESLGAAVHFSQQNAERTNFPDGHFDWMYVDASHFYDDVKRDLQAFFPKLRAGGYIAGDDYDRRGIWDHGVTRAVDEFRASGVADTIRLKNHQFLLRKR